MAFCEEQDTLSAAKNNKASAAERIELHAFSAGHLEEVQDIADQSAWRQIYLYKAAAARTTSPATKAFQAPIGIMAAPPVLVGEDVAPAAVPEPDDDVVVMPAADELADEEPEAELDTLEDDPVDMADDTVVPDPPVVAVVAVAAASPGE
jgi:hypothetical protein